MRKIKLLGLVIVISLALTVLTCAEIAKEDGNYVETYEKSFAVKTGGTFTLKADAGSVKAGLSKDDKLHVTIKKTADVSSEEKAIRIFKEITISEEIEDNDVLIKVDIEDSSSRLGVKYEIAVPANYNVALNTGGGSMWISDLIGNVKLNTGGGSIRAGNIEGSLSVNTGGGSIKVGNVKNGKVSINSGGGSLKIDNIEKDVKANTGGGSIKIGSVGGKAVVNTGGGSINIGPTGGFVKANTGGGSIKVKAANGITHVNTGGGSINIDSASGSIHGNTGGGSITATFLAFDKSGESDVSFSTGGGDITLYIPADLAATFDIKIEIDDEEVELISDFALTQKKDDDELTATGDINGGGPKITLKTCDSDVIIKKIVK